MDYNFKCSVIDDEIEEITERLSYAETMLLEDHNIKVDMEVSQDISKDKLRSDYDILLIDYDLSKKSKLDGDVIISEIRKRNRIVKIIFYSSKFTYNEESKKFKFVGVSDNTIYKIINQWKVDKVIPKNNLNILVSSIKECCEEFDITLLGLYKSIEKYIKEGIKVNYRLKNGKELSNNELLNELKKDSTKSKEIRDKISKFTITNILDFEY